MRLRTLIGVKRLFELTRFGIYIRMTLSWTFDAIGKMKTGIKPLRRIGSTHLLCQHIYQFIIKGLSILGRIEIAMGLSPVSPASCKPVKNLPGICLSTILCVDTFSAEIFLSQNIYSDLRPKIRNQNIFRFENNCSIKFRYTAHTRNKIDAFQGVLTFDRKVSCDLHVASSLMSERSGYSVNLCLIFS